MPRSGTKATLEEMEASPPSPSATPQKSCWPFCGGNPSPGDQSGLRDQKAQWKEVIKPETLPLWLASPGLVLTKHVSCTSCWSLCFIATDLV